MAGATGRYAGIVLTAGRSSRMGAPKALLQLDGTPFLARVIRALAEGGCSPVVAVVGSSEQQGNAEIRQVAAEAGARIAENPDPESEQVDSIRAGFAGLGEEVSGIVVSPVDAPRITAGVVESLIQAAASGALVAVPTSGGRRGHPILFAGEALIDLFEPLPAGARTLMRRHEARLVEVPIDSPDVLLDVDTPEQFRRLGQGAR